MTFYSVNISKRLDQFTANFEIDTTDTFEFSQPSLNSIIKIIDSALHQFQIIS